MGLLIGKMRLFLLIFAISAASQGYCQSDSITTVYLGGSIGVATYTVNQDDISVSPYYRTNSEIGIVGVFNFNNKLFSKTGLFYNNFRSPFVNNVSTYNEFLQVPMLISFIEININDRKHLNLLIGPQVSVLTRYGSANFGDDSYMMINSLGGFYKIGATFEASWFSENNSFLNSFGLKLQLDIPSLTIKSNDQLIVNDNFISGGIYYNLNKKSSK